jgi:hypothetical protein
MFLDSFFDHLCLMHELAVNAQAKLRREYLIQTPEADTFLDFRFLLPGLLLLPSELYFSLGSCSIFVHSELSGASI